MFPFLKFRIEENSMSPYLISGDLVIIFKTKNVKKNDVIIFDNSGDYFVKRIKQIKRDKYFVEGDNKKESVDSRKFGWIDKKNILGKVIFKI